MHHVSQSCEGERCACGAPATHKVSEVIQWDDPAPARHPLTAYVCCRHFRALVGPAAPCGAGDDPLTVQGMADCMDMVRLELVEAGVIDARVPPMMVADAVLAHLARAQQPAKVPVPATPQAVVDFVGSNFDSMEEAPDPADIRYQLSVHDLLSAFQSWFESPHPPAQGEDA